MIPASDTRRQKIRELDTGTPDGNRLVEYDEQSETQHEVDALRVDEESQASPEHEAQAEDPMRHDRISKCKGQCALQTYVDHFVQKPYEYG